MEDAVSKFVRNFVNTEISNGNLEWIPKPADDTGKREYHAVFEGYSEDENGGIWLVFKDTATGNYLRILPMDAKEDSD